LPKYKIQIQINEYKRDIRETIIALYEGNKSFEEIPDVLHLLNPNGDYHSIDVNNI
jgi:hypothetical protein